TATARYAQESRGNNADDDLAGESAEHAATVAVVSVPTAPPYDSDQKEYHVRQIAGDKKLTPTQRLIGVCLVLHLNKTTGQLNPGIATLAKEAGSTKTTVELAIDALVSRGHIRVIAPGRAGRGNSAQYGCCRWLEKGILAADLFERGQTLFAD